MKMMPRTLFLLLSFTIIAIGIETTTDVLIERHYAGLQISDGYEISTAEIMYVPTTARALASEASSVGYRINDNQSRFAVEVGTAGAFGFLGHDHHIAIRKFTGEINLTPGIIKPASVEIRVKSDSLEEIGPFNRKDRQTINKRMRENVLEVAKYSEIIFKSTSVSATKAAEDKYSLKIKGNLTLHGVTRQIVIPVEVRFDNNALRANGNFQLDRDDYNIRTESVALGTIKVSDKLKVLFEIVAHKT
ncbi:MAG: YceI family protein [Candidatus Tectomicrobia bacterium]|uniref:YceI family protein n=1 Tax=Tectimicrobiota bacterium TaxID=2528274 RepID=A0A932FUH9_UNCTE|nr:YceI family protein [Candidatus Tectomicrobia bacterium]